MGAKAGETFDCECIECGHKLTSEKHCNEIKCPECGGTMRREDRPGPGQRAAIEVVKDERRAIGIGGEQMEIKTVSKEEADEGNGFIEGYSAIFDLVDSDREFFAKGAFKKTIKERVPSRKRGESLEDHMRRCHVSLMTEHIARGGGLADTIGTITEGKEDDIGLWYHAELSSLQNAQDARTLVQEGHVKRNSVGFGVIGTKWEAVEGFETEILAHTECKWYENTLTIIPANENAVITASKSLGDINTILAGLDLERMSADDRTRLIHDSFGGNGGLKALRSSLDDLTAKIAALLDGPSEPENRTDLDTLAHEIEMRRRELDLLTL